MREGAAEDGSSLGAYDAARKTMAASAIASAGSHAGVAVIDSSSVATRTVAGVA